jgi:RNA-directed DNA polymerase
MPTATAPLAEPVDAVKEAHRLLCRGYTDVVDADLSRYFDTIPHNELLKSVARRVADGSVLRLIKLWLKAPIEERDADGTRRMSGGKSGTRGTPQGGVASPLLANIYMNRFLKHWRLTERGEAFAAHIISYADDFVILSRGRAAEALTWTKAVMTKLGLTLNEAKTSLKNAWQTASTSLATRSALIVIRRTAKGIWAQARPRRACNGSSGRSATCWCPAITSRGQKCATR